MKRTRFLLFRCELVFIWLEIVCGESVGPLKLVSKNLMESKQDYCLKEAECRELNNFTCLGMTLPYTKTSNHFTSLNQNDTQDILNKWKVLQSVPKCWSVIQPLLCAIYMPKCENGFVTLPSQEMCNITRGPCRVVAKEQKWPNYLLCENDDLFPSGCKVFSKILFCLVFFPNIFQITFLIDWKNANKYPAVVIFYINICFLINCIGWLAQFTPGARRNIVCHQDGTFRQGEPRNGSNLSCIIVFILTYYSLMASIVWFVILAYTWSISFRNVGIPRDLTEGKAAYFHMVSWSLPLILTITIMALSEVNGSSIYGICFVGYINQSARGGFLLVPVALATVIGIFFLLRGRWKFYIWYMFCWVYKSVSSWRISSGSCCFSYCNWNIFSIERIKKSLLILIKVKIKSGEIIKDNMNMKIQYMIIRIAIFTFLCLLFVSFSFGCHIYEYKYQQEWKNSLWKYIVCSAKKAAEMHENKSTCSFKNRMSPMVIYLHLISVFGTGILMSSWVWTASCVNAWKRFFYR
ncbi:smoothened homolog [Centruroides sculpturatus]|uniref:smoothened homolog n=1 Tax=Centruroides sculpturatus TaxID=218467 RepID=UPI000C6CA073|nr:smoothened homolog [Centruroides sculpturatus]